MWLAWLLQKINMKRRKIQYISITDSLIDDLSLAYELSCLVRIQQHILHYNMMYKRQFHHGYNIIFMFVLCRGSRARTVLTVRGILLRSNSALQLTLLYFLNSFFYYASNRQLMWYSVIVKSFSLVYFCAAHCVVFVVVGMCNWSIDRLV